MYELEQWSGADIAEALSIPVDTVYSCLHYARRKLASRVALRFAADGRCVAFEEWPFAPE